MKRTLCLCLALLCVIALFGCHLRGSIRSPATFYYPRTDFVFGKEHGLFGCELRESAGLSPEQLLDQYLKGPKDPVLTCQIPDDTSIISLAEDEAIITITLSDSFADLTGIDLTVACTGLAKTCMEYTGTQNVVLRAETMQLDGQDQLLFSADSIHYFDNTDVTTTEASDAEGT